MTSRGDERPPEHRRRGGPVIARTWRGTVRRADADIYADDARYLIGSSTVIHHEVVAHVPAS
jgi:hypothetical protein